MTYRGKVQRGAIVLEKAADLPEGALVRIELLPDEDSAPEAQSGSLLEMTSLAVETGIPDLAANVDQYLYGHSKAAQVTLNQPAPRRTDLIITVIEVLHV